MVTGLTSAPGRLRVIRDITALTGRVTSLVPTANVPRKPHHVQISAKARDRNTTVLLSDFWIRTNRYVTEDNGATNRLGFHGHGFKGQDGHRNLLNSIQNWWTDLKQNFHKYFIHCGWPRTAYSSVTSMLFELSLPSFDTLLHNCNVRFYLSLGTCENILVQCVKKVN